VSQLPLELWRRIDWRFLLPDLDVGTVVCGSRCDEQLVAALRLLEPTTLHVVAEVGWETVAEGSVDVAVLAGLDPAELRRAALALRPGGWVYAEIYRGPAWALPRTWGLLGARRTLRSAGLQDVAMHWHAPDIRTCARIVPLQGREAVRATLLRHEGVRFGHLKSGLGRGALRAGLFPLGVPEGSVLGRRPDSAPMPA